jgi:hypothetical protein
MGLDIYVGSLTRYFTHDWKTVVQQLAERGEIPQVQVIRANEPKDAVTDPEQVRSAVLAWRQGLSAGLAQHIAAPLDWEESGPTPYFTDKPAWDCYGALLLWAAYSEHADLKRPTANPLCLPERKTGDWHDDPAYQRSVAEGHRTRYGQLLHDVEFWLPAGYDFTFGAPWVTGDARRFGACGALVAQLDDLNARTWRAAPEDLIRWRRDNADFGAPLEVAAQFAFAVVRDLAGKASENRLPMLLDY